MRNPRVRLLSLAALSLALGALPFGAAQATSDDGGRSSAPSLPHAAHGAEAIQLLGDQLDEAAALNSWTPAQLRRALSTDSTAWVDTHGRVYYKDLPATGPAPTEVAEVAPFPLGDTFLLHSKAGSQKTLFIDFDGTNVSGTYWNTDEGVPAGNYPAWTLDGDAATFNDAEREAIQTIWQRVAEDYAPFDIDVTTQDPGLAGIQRVNTADQVYGTRALVTPSTVAEGAICGTPTPSCGGVAYIDVFGLEDPDGTKTQPAWVFPQSLSNSPKNIAEAVSHEVGHNFSLQHDGITNGANQGAPCSASLLAYYCGHNQYAPIMGAGYYRPVTQWSKGEYATANNTTQDDVAIIASRTPFRTDEAGGTLATASTTPTGTKYVTEATDQDIYLLGTCTGSLTVSAASPAPATPSPDLDIKLELLNSSGAVVATDDPPSAFVSAETASGLTASIAQSVGGGSYFLRVDGVGVGTPQTGYSDYGSLGAYALTISAGVCTAPAGAPAAPASVVATGNAPARTAAVSWAAPANIGGSAVTGYNVYVNGALTTTTTATTATLTGLAIGTPYDVSVSATNGVGTGPQAHATPLTLLEKPSAPAITKVKSGKPGGKKTAKVSWSAPTSTGGTPITGYQVLVFKASGGAVFKTFTVAAGKTSFKAKLPGGKYKFAIVAVNAVGAGPQSALSKKVTAK